MTVLVLDSARTDLTAVVRVLSADGYLVNHATDFGTAIDRLQKEKPGLLIVDMAFGPGRATELIRLARSTAAGPRTYIIATSSRTSGDEIAAAFSAGADDFLRKPIIREELLARSSAPERIRRWAGAGHGGTAIDWSEGFSPARTQTWRDIREIVSADLAELAGHPVVVAEPVVGARWAVGAMQMLTMTGVERLQQRVYLGLERHILPAAAELFLGDATASLEGLRDMIREVTNIAAGAIKRSALAEGVEYTIGMPTELLGETIALAPNTPRQIGTFRVAGTEVRILFATEIVPIPRVRVRATELKEGMVVAEDIRSSAGVLLLRIGTRLTSSAAVRVASLIGQNTLVEVSEAA